MVSGLPGGRRGAPASWSGTLAGNQPFLGLQHVSCFRQQLSGGVCESFLPDCGKHHEHTLGLVIATANAIEREIMLNSVLNERRIVLSQQEAILKIVDTGIIAIDKNGTISTINQQAMDAFSVSSSWVGKSSMISFRPSRFHGADRRKGRTR